MLSLLNTCTLSKEVSCILVWHAETLSASFTAKKNHDDTCDKSAGFLNWPISENNELSLALPQCLNLPRKVTSSRKLWLLAHFPHKDGTSSISPTTRQCQSGAGAYTRKCHDAPQGHEAMIQTCHVLRQCCKMTSWPECYITGEGVVFKRQQRQQQPKETGPHRLGKNKILLI